MYVYAIQHLSVNQKLGKLYTNPLGLINLMDIEICRLQDITICKNSPKHSHILFQYRGTIPDWAKEQTILDLVTFLTSHRDAPQNIYEHTQSINEPNPITQDLWDEFRDWVTCRDLVNK